MPRTLLKRILFGAIFVAVLGYAAYQSQYIVRGAVLTVTTPQDGETVHEALLPIEGTVTRAAHITLDDNPIFSDPQGHFSEKLLLAPGSNTIKLTVEDRFKRTQVKLITVFYEAPPDIPQTASSTSTR